MIEAVIFDMDGVLIDSEPLHFAAIETVLNKYGINIDDSELDRFVGDTNERVWAIFKEEHKLPEPIEFYIEQQLQSTIECLENGSYKPIDGVTDLLQQLKEAGFGIAVASSSPPNVIATILKVIGIEKYIDKWVSGNEVQESKPAPYIYLRAAELIGKSPAQCVAIEDSFYGVTAAKAAGIKCIGYKDPGATDQDLSQADLIVKSMKEITVELIKNL